MAKQQQFTDPETEQMCKLLGSGYSFKAITLSRDQVENIMRMYGYYHETEKDWPSETIEVPENPYAYGSETKMVKKVLPSAARLAESAMLVNMRRRAEHDGFRMLAVLAKFCERGQDPVKLLVQLMSDAGYDVGSMVEWAFDEEG